MLQVPDPKLRDALDAVCRAISSAGGRALVVGGAVRDALLDLPLHDLDVEVYGLDADRLQAVLGEHFALDLVGRSFGVLKIKHLAIDVSLPRRESKRGLGHKGFEIRSDPHLSFEEAASRRDFTINAMSFDPLTEELIDPVDGRADLEAGVLRHVSEKFVEDPLRVLRAMQFLARFEMRPADETVALCRTIEREGLARERVYEEWKKLILQGRKISAGLHFLRDCGWIREFPELEALIDCPQDPKWHPEGDVWIHTLHVMDAYATERVGDDWEDLVVGFACLCHDLGKPATTTHDPDGHIRSKNHEEQGDPPTRSFLARFTDQEQLVQEVVPLVREHLKPFQLWDAKAGPAAVRRLARRVGRIDRLVRVARADQMGRPPLPFDGCPAGEWLLARAEELAVTSEGPQPIVLGRHLIELGLRPGPHFKKLLDACFEAQIEGEFSDLDGGLVVARRVIAQA